ncbi:MAG TPA: zf-HC2 domain-containing protein [Acidimicrobiales bacterium]|nr:zf-HC2 domain-containing protein [Acidimicrobiales bacterium]
MTPADHDRLRELTAAHVLGALDAADRAELEVHLEVCETCRQDVVDFAPLPALLARLDLAEVAGDSPAVSDAGGLVDAVRADVARIERSRRWWQRSAVAVAVAAAVAVGAVLFVDDGGTPDDPWPGVAMAVEVASSETTAHIVADERDWGTYVHVTAEDLPARDLYAVWTVDRSGRWAPVGSWAPTPDGRAELGCSTALALAEIDRVVITSADRDDELLVAR